MPETLSLPLRVSKEDIERLEASLLPGGVTAETFHTFAPGVYVRTAVFPAGHVFLGHEHKTEHISIISEGRFQIIEDGECREVVAPAIFVTKPGVRKVALFAERTVWSNVLPNPSNETSVEKLEDVFVIKSAAWLSHQARLAEKPAEATLT
jgi:quercetin dioxygenase-like cupin family protein